MKHGIGFISNIIAVGLFALTSTSYSQEGIDSMLATNGSFKPKITVTESHTEKLVTTKFEGEVFRDVVPSHVLTISIVANMAGIDLTSVTAETQLGVSVGEYNHSATVGDDPTWKLGKRKAIFPLTFEDDLGRVRRIGTVTYSWNQKTFAIVVTTKEETEAISAAFVGQTTEDGKALGFAGAAPVSISFGANSGARSVYFKGVSKVVTRIVGRGENAEEFSLNTVTLSGAADIKAPVITMNLPKTTPEIQLDIQGTLKDSPGNLSTIVSFKVNGLEGAFDEINHGVEEKGITPWTASLVTLEPGLNAIEVIAMDGDGNTSKLVKKITSTGF